MRKKVDQFIYSMMNSSSFKNDEELYLYLVLLAAACFQLAVHIFLFSYYISVQYLPLALYNVVSMISSFVCFALAKRKQYGASGLLLSIEVMVYTFLSCVLTGIYTFTIMYYFLVMVMQVVIPYTRNGVRMFLLGTQICQMMITFCLGYFLAPVHVIDKGVFAISVFNLLVAVIGSIIELSVGNEIKIVIARFNFQRINDLSEKVFKDELTGLYNRHYATDFFRRLPGVPTEKGWCVAMLDIDDFKVVNDTFGHAAGDEVLCCLAKSMKTALRNTDVIFRWGGEEFLLVLSNVSLKTAGSVLEKMRKTLQEISVSHGDKCINITVTMGVSVLDMLDINGSIARCDEKLYHGKRQGKNQVVL